MEFPKWVMDNLQWILGAFIIINTIVRATPWKQDDIIFDMILKPIWDVLKGKKKG